jgi:hypothetical protein
MVSFEAALPLKPTRRAVLMVTLGAGLSSLCSALHAQAVPPSSLAALVDALLPADDMSPAATALGVDAEISDFVAGSEMMTRLFAAALDWIDQLADRPFRDLTALQQAEVLTYLQTADFNAVPGRFYHILRALAVEFYFARAEVLGGLALNAAPQPDGYMQPWR